ncbi:shikimate dehydrogenase [Virgibacillus soli]|uniref:Shikimate dehydrogenase (NADP(+)) n=1 Tax=Paracerasibacillus soli TaxID=480284 RepID=A0ABU5CRK9_9BACI|nr:shikimate dehydrogenase [Virgibacillus soli]MDY0408506.1 shikimate dehydrogenase [Virgibacillus soli]
MFYKLGLIGYPIEHSLSPWIHMKLLEETNLTGSYMLYEFPSDSFQNRLESLKMENLVGFNVTVPYKQKIIHYLDSLDETAKLVGAVNTVYNKNGSWVGYNTDGIGYTRALYNTYPNFYKNKENRILIIGAGGAARGIFFALAQAGFKNIDITNRTLSHAENVAKISADINTNLYSLKDVTKYLAHYDLIIQTTSVGMKPNVIETAISLDDIRPSTIVSDIVYQPYTTQLLHDAQNMGAQLLHGHLMLLYQAQYAFEIWTKQSVSVEKLMEQLKQKLEGR